MGHLILKFHNHFKSITTKILELKTTFFIFKKVTIILRRSQTTTPQTVPRNNGCFKLCSWHTRCTAGSGRCWTNMRSLQTFDGRNEISSINPPSNSGSPRRRCNQCIWGTWVLVQKLKTVCLGQARLQWYFKDIMHNQ